MTDEHAGRYVVGRHWGRWTVLDQSHNPAEPIGRPHTTHAAAQAAADRLNNPPRPAHQPTLFNTQEAAS